MIESSSASRNEVGSRSGFSGAQSDRNGRAGSLIQSQEIRALGRQTRADSLAQDRRSRTNIEVFVEENSAQNDEFEWVEPAEAT